MDPTELLRLVGERLDRIGCPWFVTGSMASTVFGEPRFTNDIDLVVRMDESQAGTFAGTFIPVRRGEPPEDLPGDEWYVSLDAAIEAVRRRGMFNVIHVPSALKADIVIARDTPHDDARFARIHRIAMADGRLEPFASPEDVILKKLEFFREGGSSKHLRDISSMIDVRGRESLDWGYLTVWADRLGVASELQRFRPRR